MKFHLSKKGIQEVSLVADQEPKISAIGMGRDSLAFLDAAKTLAGEQGPLEVIITHVKPLYYLLCHSMELSMKSYLRTKGYEDDKLKKIWHGLKNCVEVVRAEGLTISDEFEQMAEWLDPYHFDNAFRYQRERMLHLPLPHELISGVEPQIRETFRIVNKTVLMHLRGQK